MVTLKPQEMSERENYKFLIGSIIPRPIAVITSLSEDGVLNIAPFSYFNIVSSYPPIVSVSIQRKSGGMKDTAHNILATNQAVIHIAEEKYLEDINQTAANLPKTESEKNLTTFTLTESKTISVPMISELQIKMETLLYQHIPIVHHSEEVADLFLLKIKQYHVDDALYNNGRIDDVMLNPMSRLAGNDYAKVGTKLTIKRPI